MSTTNEVGDGVGEVLGGVADVGNAMEVEELTQKGERIVELAKEISSLTTFGDREEALRWWHPFRYVITVAHDSTGIPWWTSITCATLILRVLMTPLSISGFRFQEAMRKIQPQISEIQAEAKELAKKGSREEALEHNKKAQDLISEQGGMWKSFVGPMSQMPVFMGMYKALQNISASGAEGLSTGGFFWLKDLSMADPTHVAPFLTAISTIVMMETARRGSTAGAAPESTQATLTKYAGRGFALFAIAFTWKLPAAFFFYWIPNTMFTTAFTSLCRYPPIFKRIMRKVDRRNTVLEKIKLDAEKKKSGPKMGDLDAAMTYIGKGRKSTGSMDTIHLLASRKKRYSRK